MMNYLNDEMLNASKIPIKYKILDDLAKEPQQANAIDAGHDMYAIDNGTLGIKETGQDPWGNSRGRIMYIQYRTGIAVEPPIGYHTELFPRSSVSKKDLVLANSIGLVDWGYRNEIIFRFKPILDTYEVRWGPKMKYLKTQDDILDYLRKTYDFYKTGERIGQLVLRKTEHYQMVKVDELSDTERGMGGLGSSGA